MESNKNNNNDIIGVAIVIAVIAIVFIALKNALELVDKKTNPKVITDKGLDALQDKNQSEKVYKAIEKANEEYEKTGVFKTPMVDFAA